MLYTSGQPSENEEIVFIRVDVSPGAGLCGQDLVSLLELVLDPGLGGGLVPLHRQLPEVSLLITTGMVVVVSHLSCLVVM